MSHHIACDSEEAYGEVFVAFLRNRLLIWALAVLEEDKWALQKRERERMAEAETLGGTGQRGQTHCYRERFTLECRV